MGVESTADEAEQKNLLLDEFDEKYAAFQTLRRSDPGAAEALLGALGAQDDVDRDIVLELSSPAPLGRPDRFEQAHALAVRSLEVLDRNGARQVEISGFGPANVIAAWLVQQAAHFLVRTLQSNVATQMLLLYERREANAHGFEDRRRMLRRVRLQMTRIAPGFKRNALGVPTFLLGGVVVSWAGSAAAATARSAFSSLLSRIAATIIIGLVVLGLAFVVLRGAAVARRRIQLTLDKPIGALWQTIGRCGEPPRDLARVIALVAVMLALLPWVLIPPGLLGSWLWEFLSDGTDANALARLIGSV